VKDRDRVIFEQYEAGRSKCSLAKEYGMSRTNVDRIVYIQQRKRLGRQRHAEWRRQQDKAFLEPVIQKAIAAIDPEEVLRTEQFFAYSEMGWACRA
jgi:hypothetical protein